MHGIDRECAGTFIVCRGRKCKATHCTDWSWGRASGGSARATGASPALAASFQPGGRIRRRRGTVAVEHDRSFFPLPANFTVSALKAVPVFEIFPRSRTPRGSNGMVSLWTSTLEPIRRIEAGESAGALTWAESGRSRECVRHSDAALPVTFAHARDLGGNPGGGWHGSTAD